MGFRAPQALYRLRMMQKYMRATRAASSFFARSSAIIACFRAMHLNDAFLTGRSAAW